MISVLEKSLENAQEQGSLDPRLSTLLREQWKRCSGQKPQWWGWSFLYDVSCWNPQSTPAQVSVFVEAVRSWNAAPSKQTLAALRTSLVLAGLNVNGRDEESPDWAALVMELGSTLLQKEEQNA